MEVEASSESPLAQERPKTGGGARPVRIMCVCVCVCVCGCAGVGVCVRVCGGGAITGLMRFH